MYNRKFRLGCKRGVVLGTVLHVGQLENVTMATHSVKGETDINLCGPGNTFLTFTLTLECYYTYVI